jgi:uncharacterized protein YecE (DUF72 family)
MIVWIGTSGYSYPDWVGPFYPAGTSQQRMLRHYAESFPLVELNYTFYRMPTEDALARLADRTPDGFQFIVKMPQTLSHEELAGDIAPFRSALAGLRQRGRLLGVLCQLPQATHDTDSHRQWLKTLAGEFAGHQLAIEFRHRSWRKDDVIPWLAELKLDLVAVDCPDLPGLYPRGLVAAGRTVYVRFHSRNADNWYRGDKDRYDYDYQDSELGEWIQDLQRTSAHADRVLLLFNNCQRAQAAANAERMRELLVRLAPELSVVEPFIASRGEPEQRFLFE